MDRIETRPAKPDSAPLTVSVSEAAKLLGVSRDLVYALVSQGELPALRLGRRIILPRRAIEELVDDAGQIRTQEAVNDGTTLLQAASVPLGHRSN